MEFHLFEWISLLPLPHRHIPGSSLLRLLLPVLHVSLWPTMVPSLFCSLPGRVSGRGHYLDVFQRWGAMWGFPGQREEEFWVPGVTWVGGGGWHYTWQWTCLPEAAGGN